MNNNESDHIPAQNSSTAPDVSSAEQHQHPVPSDDVAEELATQPSNPTELSRYDNPTSTINKLRNNAARRIARPTTIERDALAALYESTDGKNWKNNTNWLTKAPLNEWHGIKTDRNGHVSYLGLHESNLNGTIPPGIGNLNNLEYLELSTNYNRLTGAIPPEIGNLKQLRVLLLWSRNLTGQIPPEIWNLKQLRELYLSSDNLTGQIPPEIGNLNNLERLNLSGNRLTGTIPAEIGKLSNLTYLNLSENRLTGEIPESIGNLSNLEWLYLSENRLQDAYRMGYAT